MPVGRISRSQEVDFKCCLGLKISNRVMLIELGLSEHKDNRDPLRDREELTVCLIFCIHCLI